MKRQISKAFLILMCLSVGITTAASFNFNGLVKNIQVHSSYTADQQACEAGNIFVEIGTTKFVFAASGDDSKSMLSFLLTAQTTGQQVSVKATDQWQVCNALRLLSVKNYP